MQGVKRFDGKQLSVPIGWAMLSKGEKIVSGDRYYNLDKNKWDNCSVADVGTHVNGGSDVIIRKVGEKGKYIDDTSYIVRITGEMVGSLS